MATITTKTITEIPFRTEPFGGIGWTVQRFESAHEAARFVQANPTAVMPCWKRFEVVNGELTLAR